MYFTVLLIRIIACEHNSSFGASYYMSHFLWLLCGNMKFWCNIYWTTAIVFIRNKWLVNWRNVYQSTAQSYPVVFTLRDNWQEIWLYHARKVWFISITLITISNLWTSVAPYLVFPTGCPLKSFWNDLSRKLCFAFTLLKTKF